MTPECSSSLFYKDVSIYFLTDRLIGIGDSAHFFPAFAHKSKKITWNVISGAYATDQVTKLRFTSWLPMLPRSFRSPSVKQSLQDRTDI